MQAHVIGGAAAIALSFACTLVGSVAPVRAADPATRLLAPVSGARAMALGGALTAAAEGIDGATWNPAALTGAPRSALGLDHRSIVSGLVVQGATFAVRPWPDRATTVAVRADVVRRSGIPTSEAIAEPGLRGQAGWRGVVEMASAVRHDLSGGISIGRTRGLPDWSGEEGWVADAGLAWQRGGTRCGLAARGALFGSSDGAEAPVVSLGVAQRFDARRLLCTAQLDHTGRGTFEPAGGIEWWPRSIVALRAGGRGMDASPSASGGLGIRHDSIHLDYACVVAHDVAPRHAISLAFDLGAPAPLLGASVAAPDAPAKPRRGPPTATTSKPASAPPAPRDEAPAPPAPRTEAPAPPAPRAEEPRPAPPATPAPAPQPPREDVGPLLFDVMAGPYATLEALASDVTKLRSADFFPRIERRGDTLFLVVKDSIARKHADEVVAAARRAGVRCKIESH